jgi:hypothetical protein
MRNEWGEDEPAKATPPEAAEDCEGCYSQARGGRDRASLPALLGWNQLASAAVIYRRPPGTLGPAGGR